MRSMKGFADAMKTLEKTRNMSSEEIKEACDRGEFAKNDYEQFVLVKAMLQMMKDKMYEGVVAAFPPDQRDEYLMRSATEIDLMTVLLDYLQGIGYDNKTIAPLLLFVVKELD